MRLVVADTSPFNYLILIGKIDLLRSLYTRIVIPVEVFNELNADGAPAPVMEWVLSRPAWMEVKSAPVSLVIPAGLTEETLDSGEAAAIRLALLESGSLLLIDEALGRSAATKLGISNTGTLGILVDAAASGFVDLKDALTRLRRTNFRIKRSLIENLLDAEPRLRNL